VRTPQTFTGMRITACAQCHDIVADTVSGSCITGSNSGGEMCGGGLHMVDVQDPLHPKFAGCLPSADWAPGTGYTHDAQCLVYHGPSTKYQGRQICFGWNETHTVDCDVTDKAHPVGSRARRIRTSVRHQGWLTDDHRYAYEDDELDEIQGSWTARAR